MRDILQIAIILAIIVVILMYVNRFNLPGGYRKVKEKTTAKYENATEPGGKVSTHYTKEIKPTREGSKITIKEETRTREQ